MAVLYHGLGRHIEFVSPEDLAVYLKVTCCQDIEDSVANLTDHFHRVVYL
jgi:hypothetical protein